MKASKKTPKILHLGEKDVRSIIEFLPVGIAIYDAKRFYYFNKTAEKIFGHSRDELCKKSWQIIHPGHKEMMKKYVRAKLLAQPAPAVFTFKAITNSGEKRWIELFTVDTELNGKRLILASGTDITERKRAEDTLKQSEERCRAILDNAGDAILNADEQGNLIAANMMAERLWGYTKAELMQMHYTQLHPEMELDKVIKTFRDLLARGQPLARETMILRKDGLTFPVNISCSLLEYGGRREFQASFRDIFEQKKAQNNLERLIRERTAELSEKSDRLAREVVVRRSTELALKKKTKEIQRHSKRLLELNAALKVILQKREEDRVELEEKVKSNVRHLIAPHLETLKKHKVNAEAKMHLEILEKNLAGIVSSFASKLSSRYIDLTPTEIKVADMIRQGKTTKEIASLLGSSLSAVNIHRFHIRRKLSLIGKTTNLQSYLSSIY